MVYMDNQTQKEIDEIIKRRNLPPEVAFYYFCAMTGIVNVPLHLSIKVMRSKEQIKRMGYILPYEVV